MVGSIYHRSGNIRHLEQDHTGLEKQIIISSFDDVFYNKSISAVEKISLLLGSDLVHHRLFLTKHILQLIEEAGLEITYSEIIPNVESLFVDTSELVRLEAAKQLPALGKYLLKENVERAETLIMQGLIPLCFNLFLDSSNQIAKIAKESTSLLLIEFSFESFVSHVLPFFEELINSTHEENFLVVLQSIESICKHSSINKKLVSDYFIPILFTLSTKSIKIRESVVESLAIVSFILTPEQVEKDILLMFSRLCDDSSWSVRNVAASKLVAIASNITPKAKIQNLLPIIQSLLNDVSNFVTISMKNVLGNLIFAFRDCDSIPDSLVTAYLECIPSNPGLAFRNVEKEKLAFSCAFHFPCVALCLGKTNWNRYLKSSFLSLSKHMDWKIRKPLSFSLHEISKILSHKDFISDILPVLETFLEDVSEVKIGVLHHLADILTIAQYEHAKKFLSNIIRIVDSSKNFWRYRFLIAEQMEQLISIFHYEDVIIFFFPLSTRFSLDPVSRVRLSIINSVSILAYYTTQNDYSIKHFFSIVNQFSESSNHHTRSQFVLIVEKLLTFHTERSNCLHISTFFTKAFFSELFPNLKKLFTDPVETIRMICQSRLSSLVKKLKIQHETIEKRHSIISSTENGISQLSELLSNLKITDHIPSQIKYE